MLTTLKTLGRCLFQYVVLCKKQKKHSNQTKKETKNDPEEIICTWTHHVWVSQNKPTSTNQSTHHPISTEVPINRSSYGRLSWLCRSTSQCKKGSSDGHCIAGWLPTNVVELVGVDNDMRGTDLSKTLKIHVYNVVNWFVLVGCGCSLVVGRWVLVLLVAVAVAVGVVVLVVVVVVVVAVVVVGIISICFFLAFLGSGTRRYQNRPSVFLWVLPTILQSILVDGVRYIQTEGSLSTPWKINMDHNHGDLEDHFPF